MGATPLILQLNFPFCFHKCSYCSVPTCKYDTDVMHRYAAAMIEELKAVGPDMDDYEVQAISIEGGSPCMMAAADLQEVLRTALRSFRTVENPFISVQTMPGQYSRSLLDRLRDTGVNHWVVGLPTTNEDLHFLLELPYNVDAVTMIDTVMRNFFLHDVSFELLYGIPGQKKHDFLSDLDRVLYYSPEHITLLPFRLEPGTKLAAKAAAGELTPMPAEEAAEMFTAAKEQLVSEGFVPYTVHDFARPGHENRYRVLELQGAAKLGAGYHAITAMEGLTYVNGHTLAEYLDHPTELETLAAEPHSLDDKALMIRECMNGLLSADGLDTACLQIKYGSVPALKQLLEVTLPQLEELGYVSASGSRRTLTPVGIVSCSEVRKLLGAEFSVE